jgi:hypothetical protein
MSESLQLIAVIAAACAALGYLLKKVIVPGAHVLVRVVADLQHLPVLEEIAEQFRSNSGSTLKDAIDRLEARADANKAAAEGFAAANRKLAEELATETRASLARLEVAIGVITQLAESDRSIVAQQGQQLLDIVRSGIRTEESGARQEASGARTEASGARTEASGARTEAADAAVASHLAEAQARADEVPSAEPPGAAADAASQSSEP